MDWITAGQINKEVTSNEYILKDLINNHNTLDMKIGNDYYHNNGDIRQRQVYYFEKGIKTVDNTKVNNKIPHNWHKLLVDQKTSYLVGKPVTVTAKDKTYTERLNKLLGENFDDTLNELVKGASNKGIEWLHAYINENGEFKFVIIPAEQVIPIFDTSRQENLECLIRYYNVVINGKTRIRAEWWTPFDVTYYIQTENGEFVLDMDVVNPAYHFAQTNTASNEVKGLSWGKVPFIPFRNNEECVGDLQYYKELVDAYDLLVSDMSNDLTEIQKFIYVIKNYGGTDLKEFMSDLRFYKAIKTDGDGGVDKLQADLPIDALKEFLDRAEENIFLFGQGVNEKTDKFGNSPSGIALKFMYSLLDMKCSIMERKFRKAIKNFIWFVTEYLKLKENAKFDFETVQVTFRKNMITNDLETVQMATQSKGIISDETIITHHPWTEEVDEEIKKVKKQQEEALDSYNDPNNGGGNIGN